MPSSFANQKALRFVFTLVVGGTFSGGTTTLTIQGLRASVHVDMAGGVAMATLNARIYGMTKTDMNKITSLQWNPQAIAVSNAGSYNTVDIYAMDGSQQTHVFSGNILNAWGIYAGMPEVYLMVQAYNNYANQVIVPNPARTTITADTTVDDVMGQLAKAQGLTYESPGLNLTVRKGQTLEGSYGDQCKKMADTYGFWMTVDQSTKTLAVVPKYTARAQARVPLISPETGLIGYPYFDGTGVQFDTLFNPAIKFLGLVQIDTHGAIPKADGSWVVTSMSYDLESQTPGGQWKATVNSVYSLSQLLQGVAQ